VFQKKRSQYTLPHIFSKRGTILTIFGSKIPRESLNETTLKQLTTTTLCKYTTL